MQKNDAKRAVNGDWREELKDWADRKLQPMTYEKVNKAVIINSKFEHDSMNS